MPDIQEDDMTQATAYESDDFIRIVKNRGTVPASQIISRTYIKTYFDTLYEPVGGASGWQEATETWNRTGNHTFTVSGDLTAKFRKGTKIRYKDGGSYEYGAVIISSHSAGTTTVFLTPNTDYTMAAATITDKYISYSENPEAYPHWFNWSPTWTNLTLGNGTQVAKWRCLPQKLEYEISVTFGSTTSIGDASFAPPITSSMGGTRPPVGEISMLDSGTANYSGMVIQVTTTSFGIRVFNASGTYAASVVISSTIPMTWTTSDELNIKGEYRY